MRTDVVFIGALPGEKTDDIKRDDYVRVLEYLPKGKMDSPSFKRKPIAQTVGEKYFSLLELTPRQDISFEIGDRVYIGEGVRDQVDHIERRIKYDWLTPTAKAELAFVLKDIVGDNEDRFVEFYNKARPMTPRQHILERLPKIGKQHMKALLDERDKKPFKSFEDISDRVKNIPDPKIAIVDEIVTELQGETKYLLFVPVIKEERGRERRDRRGGRDNRRQRF